MRVSRAFPKSTTSFRPFNRPDRCVNPFALFSAVNFPNIQCFENVPMLRPNSGRTISKAKRFHSISNRQRVAHESRARGRTAVNKRRPLNRIAAVTRTNKLHVSSERRSDAHVNLYYSHKIARTLVVGFLRKFPTGRKKKLRRLKSPSITASGKRQKPRGAVHFVWSYKRRYSHEIVSSTVLPRFCRTVVVWTWTHRSRETTNPVASQFVRIDNSVFVRSPT